MSLFDSLIKELVGVSGSESLEHPCRNCPSDCALAPAACSVCSPYKEQLIEELYKVDHIDEIRAQYVVSGVGETATAKCPFCGATSTNTTTCDYCGSSLGEGSEKIIVASALDIPNPIMDAQDIIFARYEAVKGGSGSSGDADFLSQVFSLLTTEAKEDSLGAKMTEDEIKEAASSYGVSISEYLGGLDNGRYMTLQGKRAASQMAAQMQAPAIPSNAHVPGLAGMAVATLLGGAMTGGSAPAYGYGNSMPMRPAAPHGQAVRPKNAYEKTSHPNDFRTKQGAAKVQGKPHGPHGATKPVGKGGHNGVMGGKPGKF